MRFSRGPAVATAMAGSAAVVTGLALMVTPTGGHADAGTVPTTASTPPPTVVAATGGPPVASPPPPAAPATGGPPVASPPPPAAPAGTGPEPPVRLDIPAIGVSADVVDVRVLASGALAVPDDPRRVGWWVGGALPGAATGTLVLAGHVDDRLRRGALFRLSELPVGATVYVDGATGRFGYRVAARRAYPKRRLPAEVFDRTAAHRLVLITCGGAFHNGHYDDNVVVYATPVT
jgi:hypothetical protein